MSPLSALRRYGIALLSVSIATLLRYYLNPLLGVRSPLLFHTFAIAVAAQYGGIISGLIATLLSVLATDFFFIAPLHAIGLEDPADILALSVFSIVGICFSIFGGRRITLLTRLHALTQDLSHRVEELETVLDVA